MHIKTFKYFFPISLFYFLLFAPVFLLAENFPANVSEEFGLFKSDETLEIVLKTNLKSLIKNKNDDEYQEGKLTVRGKSYPVRLKARGNPKKASKIHETI